MITGLPGHVALAIGTRGGHVENVHYGSLAVVAADGTVLASAGDAGARIFARSTIKPFQALPLVLSGGLERFGWGGREIALLCASHSAEAEHLEVVRQMLASSGHRADELACGAHVPMHYAAVGEAPPSIAQWSALHNNCSGKHAGFLACCALHGWTIDGHLDYAHPLQARIREALAQAADCDVASAPHGIDGCSAPNYALPLTGLARAFGAFAAGTAGRDVALARALGRLRDGMRAHPLLVSGRQRFDLLLAEAGGGDWLAKVGADGVQLLGSVSRGVGIALKLADGNPRVVNTVVVDVLRQLGWLESAAAEVLGAWEAPPLRNWRGIETGAVRSCLSLLRH